MKPYQNHYDLLDKRVEGLLSRMTLDEKIAQLGGVWGMELLDNRRFSPEKARTLIKDGIGQVNRVGVGTTLEPQEIAEYANSTQKYLLENTRLAIPALIHEECLNGFAAKGATVFPQAIGMASSWDIGLIQRIGEVIRKQMKAVGLHQGLAPVLDIAREPRWGRIEETYGEDPYLVARLGIAYVQGLQGQHIKDGIIATLKHFAGYGKPEGGLNHAPADITTRMLKEVYLYPFIKAIKEAGAFSIMNGYHEVDGVPCAASKELLTQILRKEWGFEGTVVSDYYAVSLLKTFHCIATDFTEAAKLAMTAGIDIELPKHECYSNEFKKEIEKGEFKISIVNRAVRRVLKTKFLAGLFERPYVKVPIGEKIFDLPEQRILAREAACKSIVLLKNRDNLLPLDKNLKTIAVIGPNADDPRNQMGDYTYAAHVSMIGMTAHSLNCRFSEQDLLPDQLTVPVVSILQGVRATVSPGCSVLYAKGCELGKDSGKDFKEALKVAMAADVVILVVGGKSGLTTECTCGEMRDRVDLNLPDAQDALIRAVYNTGKPVILVIVDGRPVTLGWIANEIPAIIEAWLPGEEGGNAVADIIFGDCNPSAKLPVSFPYSVGQLPVYYGVKPSGGKSQFWGDYVDSCTGPLYEFGYGLSYTTFDYKDLAIKPQKIDKRGKVMIEAGITNTGKVEGEEIAQLYINDVVASITRPVKQLKGFQRVSLKPGQTERVQFELPVEELGYYDKNMRYIVEPGVFKVMVGRSSQDIALEGQFEVEA
ncbi:MAG: glycoside hydrolase family 3 N-terminal domain-containing protein [Dehalococcoidia bacterium]|nr:glycoside hydrolase family 3 N-terminal domain-containing protein [Dehalococcoidia bacterium]MDD5494497.1 glycoside hydrolase family 3 N-terminal domain-containing protein [Dehalococcoidia bacterium]